MSYKYVNLHAASSGAYGFSSLKQTNGFHSLGRPDLTNDTDGRLIWSNIWGRRISRCGLHRPQLSPISITKKKTHPSPCIATPLPTTLTLPSIQDSPCTILSVDHSSLHNMTAHHCRPRFHPPLRLPSSSLLILQNSSLAGGKFRQCYPS